MPRAIIWIVTATAVITLIGLNAGALQTVAVLTFIIIAALTLLFNQRWPRNFLRNLLILVLGPVVVIAVARFLFASVRLLDIAYGAVLVLVLFVVLFLRRGRGNRLL